jgi:hypothetical protein
MRSIRVIVALMCLYLVARTGNSASAAGTVPLPNPPPPGTPTASTIRDAMLAIERAAATNPSAAQNAAFSYNAAIEQFKAHEFSQARASALTAISQSLAPAPLTPPMRHAPMDEPFFPGPRYYVIPDELPATAANAQRYVDLAHRAMASCVAPKSAATEYRGAVSALNAKQYRVAMASSRNIVDDCTGH